MRFMFTEKKLFAINRLSGILWGFLRLFILVGLSFMIIYPFLIKTSSCFMSLTDLTDPSVKLFPKQGSVEYLKKIFLNLEYPSTMIRTGALSVMVAVLQTFIASISGYGLARFKFPGRNIVFVFVMVILLIPPQTLLVPLSVRFIRLNMAETFLPFVLLSSTGMGLKNGLYIFILRQFFRGMPGELEEAAYIDGAGPFRCFVSVMLPNARNMIITVMILSFTWQWTDNTATPMFLRNVKTFATAISTLGSNWSGDTILISAMNNIAIILIALPLIIIFFFTQRFIIQGVEQSGITG